MMPHYRGMSRGLCRVIRSCGLGMGHYALQLRFKLVQGLRHRCCNGWATIDAGALHAPRPRQHSPAARRTDGDDDVGQRIRGADAGVDWALLATGYQESAVNSLAQGRAGWRRTGAARRDAGHRHQLSVSLHADPAGNQRQLAALRSRLPELPPRAVAGVRRAGKGRLVDALGVGRELGVADRRCSFAP